MFHSGRVTLRNRRFLRRYNAVAQEDKRILPSAEFSDCSAPPPEDRPQKRNVTTNDVMPHGHTATGREADEVPMQDIFSNPSAPMQTDASNSDEAIAQRKMPRALKNLLTFNKPGLKEQ